MRKLGKGQAVVFCATKEIQMKIRACTSKTHDETIEVRIPTVLPNWFTNVVALICIVIPEANPEVGDTC